MWDLPGPGIEPVSPALAGGFLTTVPPGKSQPLFNNGDAINILQENYLLCGLSQTLPVVLPNRYGNQKHLCTFPKPLRVLFDDDW